MSFVPGEFKRHFLKEEKKLLLMNGVITHKHYGKYRFVHGMYGLKEERKNKQRQEFYYLHGQEKNCT